MSLEKASIVWSAKQLSGMVKNGKINFEHIIQRSYCWERSRKSALIESMILGYPIPAVFAKRIDDGSGKRGSNTYYIMDGKQRLSTVKEFLNDEFALSELPTITYFDTDLDKEVELNISGMKYSDLPDGLKDFINTVTFSVTYFDNLTKNEERELFKRLNAGRPLSAKNKTLASAKNIEELLDLGSHELFNQMLTDKSRQNKNQAVIVAKVLTMLNSEVENISFASKDFNPEIEKLEISDEEKLELVRIFNYIVNIHDELKENHEKDVAKKIYTEVHLISLIPFLKRALNENINESIMSEWLITFFKVENDSKEYIDYMNACTSGVARNTSIVARNKALEESYNKFFKMDEKNKKCS
ncbi:MAG: DUF262 domain-containing protein [bacterium]|nr:DUF262 domain-containing protein [bacterium]